jgi:hypothetical protein
MVSLNPCLGYWVQVNARELELLNQRRVIIQENLRRRAIEGSQRYIPTALPDPIRFPPISIQPAPRTACPTNPEAHTTFSEIKAEMAIKCDRCGDIKSALLRCTDCPCQLCTSCWDRNGGMHNTAERPYTGDKSKPGQSEGESVPRGEVTHTKERRMDIRPAIDLTMDIDEPATKH